MSKNTFLKKLQDIIQSSTQEALKGGSLPSRNDTFECFIATIQNNLNQAKLNPDSFADSEIFEGCKLSLELESQEDGAQNPTRHSPAILICTTFSNGPRYDYSQEHIVPLGYYDLLDLYVAQQGESGLPDTLLARYGDGQGYISHNIVLLGPPTEGAPLPIREAYRRFELIGRFYNGKITFNELFLS